MEKINVMQTVNLSSPHLFGLLVTEDTDNKLNVMGVSWFSFASLKPPKMIFCLGQKGYTGEVIKETGKATLCLVTEEIKKEAFACCKSSGRDADKFNELDLEAVYAEGFEVPAVKGSKLAWALKTCDTMKAGDHDVFLADVTDAAVLSDKKALYAFEGYSELRVV